ncbi:MAG: hypothetical protein ACYCZV_09510 [Acidimicrobiales bacterium]
MHVRLTLVEGVQDMERAAKVLAEQVVPGLKEQKGFAGLTASADKAAGLVGVISLWQTEADLEASSSADAERPAGVTGGPFVSSAVGA